MKSFQSKFPNLYAPSQDLPNVSLSGGQQLLEMLRSGSSGSPAPPFGPIVLSTPPAPPATRIALPPQPSVQYTLPDPADSPPSTSLLRLTEVARLDRPQGVKASGLLAANDQFVAYAVPGGSIRVILHDSARRALIAHPERDAVALEVVQLVCSPGESSVLCSIGSDGSVAVWSMETLSQQGSAAS
jgi:hypothetical protein